MSPEPGGAHPAAGEALDPQVLAELRTVGGDALVRELMTVFAERTPGRLRSAEEAAAAGDLAAAAAAAHSLRSAAGTVGAHRLVELAGRVERAARDGRADALAAGLRALGRESEVVLAEVGRMGR